MSTFHGLEVAKSALFTQQTALYTTGHNIANANTPGYTRQRVNFEQISPYPPASRNRPEMPGQLGSGVQAGTIERVRDQFLDQSYRGKNSQLGYYGTMAGTLTQLESVMNEPSEQGLSKTMDQFWQSLQDLSVNPDKSGARSVVMQRGQAVAKTFNYMSDSLSSIRTDLKNEIDITQTDMNSLLTQINNVNKQIGEIEPNGYLPNDLYDERDRLIDKLSGIANVKVSYEKSTGQPLDIAMGRATIELVDGEGKTFDPPVTLVNGATGEVNEVSVEYNESETAVSGITIGDQTFTGKEFTSNGSLKALIESHGYVNDGEDVGVYPDMLANLDKMAYEFANAFNAVHKEGFNLAGEEGENLFTVPESESGAAASISVSDEIQENPDLIAASADGTKGDGSHALALAEAMRKPIDGLGENTSVKSFYESVIGEMAVITQEALRQEKNTTVLRQQVQESRQSVSAVSLDEEMTNMIKFQHAYNAAARSITAVDEMLDRIINNMGIVGR